LSLLHHVVLFESAHLPSQKGLITPPSHMGATRMKHRALNIHGSLFTWLNN